VLQSVVGVVMRGQDPATHSCARGELVSPRAEEHGTKRSVFLKSPNFYEHNIGWRRSL
jgi:hypothetical protein